MFGFGKKQLSDADIIGTREMKKVAGSKNWPFASDTVIIQKRGEIALNGDISKESNYVTILIDGKVYGLNGAAQDKYGLKSTHDAKKALRGMDVSDYITIGLKIK